MGKKTYTAEQEKWIVDSIRQNKYERTTEFVYSFNKEFSANKTWNQLKDKIDRLNLSCDLVGKNEYTCSERKWIMENYNEYPSVEDVLIAFNKVFNTNKSLSSFRGMANTALNLKRNIRTIMYDGYTDEQVEWLRHVCTNRVYSGICEIVDEFNKKFNSDKTRVALQSKISKLGLNAKKTHYSKEEVFWISENKDNGSWNELAVQFSNKFKRKVTGEQLKHASNDKGYFKCDPYKSCDTYHIGDEMISDNGHVYVKTGYARNIETKTTHPSREVFKPKGRMVWEEHFGEIPDGYQITFLDGNKTNCDISNLKLIPITISGVMSKNGFWNIEDAELKKAAIMYCQLVHEIKKQQCECQ